MNLNSHQTLTERAASTSVRASLAALAKSLINTLAKRILLDTSG